MLLAPQPQPREMFGCGHPPKNTFTAELWQVVNNFSLKSEQILQKVLILCSRAAERWLSEHNGNHRACSQLNQTNKFCKLENKDKRELAGLYIPQDK